MPPLNPPLHTEHYVLYCYSVYKYIIFHYTFSEFSLKSLSYFSITFEQYLMQVSPKNNYLKFIFTLKLLLVCEREKFQ